MPELGPQEYKPSPTYSQSTADITPEYRAQLAADSIEPCKANDLIAAGFLQDSAGFFAFMNSKGNFGYAKNTDVNYTCTVRTSDGHGSGWVTRNVEDVNKFATLARSVSHVATLDVDAPLIFEESVRFFLQHARSTTPPAAPSENP